MSMQSDIRLDAIPEELRRLRQWVCWRYEKRGGKLTKVPIDCITGRWASSTDPKTWTTFDHSVAYGKTHDVAGIGFVFVEGGGIVGIDLDKCRNPETGVIEPWAQGIIDRLASYSEVTPSRTGVHVIISGALPPKGRRKRRIEMYDSGRFFTMTGQHLEGTPTTINDRAAELLEIHAETFGKPKPPNRTSSNASAHVRVAADDAAIIEKARNAKNGVKFTRLWSGDTSDYDGDESRADLALCFEIAFWVGPDQDRIDALFRQSGLYRKKWERADYRQRTIAKALEGRSDFYDWQNGKDGGQQLASNGRASLDEARDQDKDSDPVRAKNEEEVNSAGRTGPGIHLTDLGNARRVVREHGKDLRFCHPWKQWLIWDGKRWAEDDTAEAVRRVKQTQGKIYRWVAKKLAELADREDNKARAAEHAKLIAFQKHLLKWEQANSIRDCLELAKSEPGIPVVTKQLDTNPFLLNVLNGTIDLRTGTLWEHRREDLITKLAPVEYDPAATCLLWDKFLDRIMDGNRDLIGYLQRLVGHLLTGDAREQSLWFFYGTGANGKSVFLITILGLLGDYAMTAPHDLLLEKKSESHPTERADLFGRRFVAAIETDEGRKFAEAWLKQITGGERVRARKCHKDSFEFIPTWKIILASNKKVGIHGTDDGIWRRIKLFPFTVQIPEKERDKEFAKKLEAERSGILAWAVRGCLDWQKHGLGEPDEVRLATSEYRREQNAVKGFLEEFCFLHPTVKCRSSLLLEAYVKWSGDKLMNPTMFATRLKEEGYRSEKGTGGCMYWQGIGLPSEGGESGG